MLTAWGKRMAAIIKNTTGSTTLTVASTIPAVYLTSASSALIEVKTISGTTKYAPPIMQGGSTALITADLVESGSSASTGVAIGSGDTAPTENDYTLETQITGISATQSFSTVVDAENEKYVLRYDYTITNDTGNDITIKEIGLFARFSTTGTKGSTPSSSNSDKKSVMIDRTLLDTPVVIANGDAGIVRYEFAY